MFDLIRVEDDRVRPAFYYALRDTLVANDLEQATRIAYGRIRYRVVTLEGHLIEISGQLFFVVKLFSFQCYTLLHTLIICLNEMKVRFSIGLHEEGSMTVADLLYFPLL